MFVKFGGGFIDEENIKKEIDGEASDTNILLCTGCLDTWIPATHNYDGGVIPKAS